MFCYLWIRCNDSLKTCLLFWRKHNVLSWYYIQWYLTSNLLKRKAYKKARQRCTWVCTILVFQEKKSVLTGPPQNCCWNTENSLLFCYLIFGLFLYFRNNTLINEDPHQWQCKHNIPYSYCCYVKCYYKFVHKPYVWYITWLYVTSCDLVTHLLISHDKSC